MVDSDLPPYVEKKCDSVDMDKAHVTLSFEGDVYATTQDCYGCLKKQIEVQGCYSMTSRFPYDFHVTSVNDEAYTFSVHFREHGKYDLDIRDSTHTLHTEDHGVFSALPLILFWLGTLGMWKVYSIIEPRIMQYFEHEGEVTIVNHTKQSKKKKRLTSLDCFRGICLTIMIYVNYGGGGYWWLNHSTWNGLTVADLVFPWFIFIMGITMAIVVDSMKRRNVETGSVVRQIIIRSMKLAALSLFLNNGFDLNEWRIPGVLMYFAISYLLIGLLVVFEIKQQGYIRNEYSLAELEGVGVGMFSDLHLYQWIFVLVLLGINLGISFTLHNEGCPKGYFGPGGLADNGSHANCTGGAHRVVDMAILGEAHFYGHPTCKEPFECQNYDPEGLLGSLNAAVLCYLGYQIGKIYVTYRKYGTSMFMKRWLAWGFGFSLLAGILCEFKQNGGFIPVNKNLWSLSFILCQAGLGTFLLAFLYFVIDHSSGDSWRWSGNPFQYMGQNSIILYFGSEVFQGYFPFSFKTEPDTHWKILLSNAIGLTCWVYIAYQLSVRKIRFSL